MVTTNPSSNFGEMPAPAPEASPPAAARRPSSGGRAASARGRGRGSSARSGARRASSSTTRSSSAASAAKRAPAASVGGYAERAILIPVGAALIARERLVTGVGDALSTYSSSSKIEAQLRRFERRGGTARKRFEREVRKTRTRFERGVRQRRRELDRRRNRIRKDLSAQVEQAQEQFEKTQSWLGDTLKSRIDDSSEIASRVQERVLSEV
jgi:hypothetical protein